MMPRMARSIVNISLVTSGGHFLDPFCGTGGVLIKAAMGGADITGCDMDRFMVRGARSNIKNPGLLLSDAAHLPIKDRSIDSVATDLPYGQSSSIMADGLEDHGTGISRRNTESAETWKKSSYRHPPRYPGGCFTNYCVTVEFHEQRVHKSLTRRIMVLET